MEKIAKLKAKREYLTEEMQSIIDLAKKENRALSDDEKGRFESLKSQDDAAKSEIEKLEAEQKLFDDFEKRKADLSQSSRKTQPATGEELSKGTFGKQKEAWEDDPMKGFKTPREFILAVMDASPKLSRGQKVDDPRIRFLTAGSDEHSTFSETYGGVFVPVGMSGMILSVPSESDPIAGRTMNVPMDTPTIKIRARTDKSHSTSVSGGLRVYRRMESDTVPASRMQHELITLSAEELFGVTYETEELMTDSPTSFAAILAAGFGDEFRSKILDERLNGTGVGQMEGVMNASAIISVAKEAGQAAATINYQNVLKMRARCWRYAGAIWLANHDTLPQLQQMVLAIGTGGQGMWQPSAREGEPDMLLGRPIYFTEYCKTLGTTGDILLCNWSQYLEGTYQGMQSAESMHVRFLEHERTFKFYMRNDGRSWWRSALTPKNGSTLSPFVKLDTRA